MWTHVRPECTHHPQGEPRLAPGTLLTSGPVTTTVLGTLARGRLTTQVSNVLVG
jgi:hypothetical protein